MNDDFRLALEDYFRRAAAPLLTKLTETQGHLIELRARGIAQQEENTKLRERLEKLEADTGPDESKIEEGLRAWLEGYLSTHMPKDGKDADPIQVQAMVDAAVARIPKPKDGDPGKSVDPTELVRLVNEIVAKLPKPESIKGEPGKDADPALIRQLVSEAVAALPRPKDGEPGKDADPEFLLKAVSQANDASALALNATEAYEKAAKSLSDATEAQRTAAHSHEAATAALKAIARTPSAFSVDAAGDLIGINAEGESKTLGHVRGQPGESVKGAPGRDALDLRPLASIDPARSYRAGICARHRGGLFCAERDTDPLERGGTMTDCGWIAYAEGFAGLTIEQVDERTFRAVEERASGVVYEHEIRLDVPIYRGVWRAAETYRKADCVTSGGSMWMALVDKPSGAPDDGKSTDWVIVVKRGRDAKTS